MDARFLLGPQIPGVDAGDKQGRAGIRRAGRKLGEADYVGHRLLDPGEVEAPMRVAVAEDEVLQEERAFGRVGDVGGHQPVGLGPAGDRGEVEAAHRLEFGGRRGVIDWGDVDDDQPLDPVPGQRRDHRRLAAHRMADQRRRPAKRVADIGGHLGIAHRVGPRRVAVVPEVERDDAAPGGEALGNRRPVAAPAEQPVQDRHRRSGAVFGRGEPQGHRPGSIPTLGSKSLDATAATWCNLPSCLPGTWAGAASPAGAAGAGSDRWPRFRRSARPVAAEPMPGQRCSRRARGARRRRRQEQGRNRIF